MASTLPSKGSKGKFAADKVIEYFWDCGNGNGDIILKTDQEPAIKCLVKDLVLERGDEPVCRTMVEESPVASKGSNGLAEKAVQEIEGQVRALKLALEGRIGQKIDAESRVVAFMAEYAAYLVNRLSVGKDGKTPYERNKGKKEGHRAGRRVRREVALQEEGPVEGRQNQPQVGVRGFRGGQGEEWRAVDRNP